jgi:CRISPR-associated protein (Cas_Cas5).
MGRDGQNGALDSHQYPLHFTNKVIMKTIHIRFWGERALFRNLSMPGTDVADGRIKERKRAIHGLLGNMLGLWRNFDDTENFGLAPALEQWIAKNKLVVKRIEYPQNPEIRILGQHRYKTTDQYTNLKKEKGRHSPQSGPKNLTYHWHVQLDVVVELAEKGVAELMAAIRQPVGTPYLGQSNCPAQVALWI